MKIIGGNDMRPLGMMERAYLEKRFGSYEEIEYASKEDLIIRLINLEKRSGVSTAIIVSFILGFILGGLAFG